MCNRTGWLMFVAPAVLLSFLTIGSTLAASPTPRPATPDGPLPPIAEMEQALTANLMAQGLETSGGYFDLLDSSDCPEIVPVMGMCYSPNPVAPYILPAMVPWHDEFVDPATRKAFGAVRPGHSFLFRLDPREAIVIMAELPPPARYFGCQTYVFTRRGSINTSNPVYKFLSLLYPEKLNLFFRLSPNPDRVLLFASLSNAINNVVIERQSGASFGLHRVFIITPDQSMDRMIRNFLTSTGVLSDTIFTEPIPSSMNLGLGENADDFVVVMRYAMPESEEQGQWWREELPLTLIRVRSTDPSWVPEPYPSDFSPEDRTANSELDLMTDLDTLNNAVRARWGLPPLTRDPTRPKDRLFELQRPDQINLVGPACVKINMHCLADTQDTNYQYSANLSLDHGNIIAIVGTLGVETRNATYVGLGLTRAEDLVGVANVSDPELKGTAIGYTDTISSEVLDKFFVWYVSHDCSRVNTANCTEISESDIPRGGTLVVSLRDYIVPDTQRGPNTEPLYDKGPVPILASWVNVIPGPQYLPVIFKDWPVEATTTKNLDGRAVLR